MADDRPFAETVDRRRNRPDIPSPPRVVGVLSPLRGSRKEPIVLGEGTMVLGRDGEIVGNFPDSSVSRRHATVARKGDEFVLEDTESRNGTFVDGVPILSCVLRRGDLIEIGDTILVFEHRFLETHS